MITMIARDHINEYYGLSDDTKPTAYVPNASTYYEMDTKKVYMYDAEHSQWIMQ